MTRQEILDLIAEELRLEVEDNYWSDSSDVTIKLMLGDRTVGLQNSENNAGWESRHEERVDKLYELGAILEQRSGDYLP